MEDANMNEPGGLKKQKSRLPLPFPGSTEKQAKQGETLKHNEPILKPTSR